jgi:hypothetical protein
VTTPAVTRQSLKVTPPSRDERPDPTPVNFFSFSYFGMDVQLDASFVDLSDLAAAARPKPGQVPTIKPHPQVKMTMSVQGFALLRSQVLAIGAALEKSGVQWDKVQAMGADQQQRP